jgi:NAD(P)-dependent dehydrogenase (short-subunit alcohol dehydrogenase family)
MNRLEGRTIVVTGAASGIGRAIAEGFLLDGAVVVGGDVQADGLAALPIMREQGHGRIINTLSRVA